MAFIGVSTMITEGETIKGVADCIDGKGAEALIVTDKNFYSFKKTGMLSSDSKAIPIEKISSYSTSGGLVKNIVISEGTSQYIYETVPNFESIINAIKTAKSENASDTTPQPKTSNETDIAVELRKMKALLDEGLITQDDFEKKKAALLGI
jgi:hypothetical protein